MPKYNNNAGFKGYDNKDNSDKRTKVSPKMILVIGVGAFIVVFIVIILIISMSGNPDYDIKQSTTRLEGSFGTQKQHYSLSKSTKSSSSNASSNNAQSHYND